MPLPLFSPPLIYTDLTLTTHQQEQIRKCSNQHEGTTFGRKNIAGSATSAITQNTPWPRY